MKKSFIVLALPICITSCAAIFEGSSQQLTINTNPPGADCAINRLGQTIERVNPTPGGTELKKTKDDITIVCNKKDYQETTYIDKSDTDWVTAADALGGIILGPITWGVDSAAGADNKYESPVNITLPKK